MTADVTFNPDFSQIESDQPQVEVNQRFALFYPELRPFFLEGAEIFDIRGPVTFVHTRTIVDPDYGGKITGKVGKTTMGLLVANDVSSGAIEDATDPAYGTSANVFVGRARYDLYSESYIGALVTTRGFLDSYSRVGLIDGSFRLGPTQSLGFRAAQADHRDLTGVDGSGQFFESRLAAERPPLDRLRRQLHPLARLSDRRRLRAACRPEARPGSAGVLMVARELDHQLGPDLQHRAQLELRRRVGERGRQRRPVHDAPTGVAVPVGDQPQHQPADRPAEQRRRWCSTSRSSARLNTYQLTDRFVLRNITEYDTFDKTVGVNMLVTYRVNAGTVFFVGYDDHYQQADLVVDELFPDTTVIHADQPGVLHQAAVSVQVLSTRSRLST